MTHTWTRRQMLTRAGAAAVGLGVAGAGIASCAEIETRSTADSGSSGVQAFISRPDLQPPVYQVKHEGVVPASPRYIFLNSPASGPGQGGGVILDRAGNLVWFGPDTLDHNKMDFRTQQYQGQTVLTYFRGHVSPAGYGLGDAVIADSSYNVTHVIKAHHGLEVDLHEFTISPQNTALITAYKRLPYDMSSVGGPAHGVMLTGVLQEIDIATGKLLFEWDSLDHIPISDSYLAFGKKVGSAEKPWDYFHINSINVAPDNNLIVSARNTCAVYKVERHTGKVMWRLNGKRSDFDMGTGSKFWWQHHVTPHGSTTLSIFDDAANPPREKQSRAIVLDLNMSSMKATLRQQFTHPKWKILTDAMGSAQLLPDGRMFVGWGAKPNFSEFDASGKLILDGTVTRLDPSYRAFTADWTGHPTEGPAVAVRRKGSGAVVYASWNGATELTSWHVLSGKNSRSLDSATMVAKTGFETAIKVHGGGSYYAVEARDARNRPLARSAPVRAR